MIRILVPGVILKKSKEPTVIIVNTCVSDPYRLELGNMEAPYLPLCREVSDARTGRHVSKFKVFTFQENSLTHARFECHVKLKRFTLSDILESIYRMLRTH